MWPKMVPARTPASNLSLEKPMPNRRWMVALNRETSTTRLIRILRASQAGPVAVSSSASKMKPGFSPTPRSETPRSCAS